MGRPRKWENEAERRKGQDTRRKRERIDKPTQFIGVDGEGVGEWRDHRYVLLGIGDRTPLMDANGLKFTQIMECLYSAYLDSPGAAFVGFFLGYDFTQWFRTLPRERAWMLLTDAGKARRARRTGKELGPFPVRWEGWEFDILGMKRFKLRREGDSGWMYVCDSGPFFQASLMSVIDPRKWNEPVVTEREYALLEQGKAERDRAVLGERMCEYNKLENIVLSRLMGRTDLGLHQAGIRLKKSQWFGPGQAAQAWLSQVGAPRGQVVREAVKRNGTVPDIQQRDRAAVQLDRGGMDRSGSLLLDAARSSYYGGWFEICAHGIIPGESWEYDINSAYPHIIARLPCLEHGRWEWSRHRDISGIMGGDRLALLHATVAGNDGRIGAMLHRRRDQSICRPSLTKGWYWSGELKAAVRAGVISDIDVDECWEYDGCKCVPPMGDIAGLYDQRLAVGKNSPAGKALKLMYNSVYGKFAQSVGDPKYGNTLYAALITSGCREMILDAITSHPEGTNAVLMVATDGVYFRNRHPSLDLSNQLGSWEEAAHERLTLFKPGVYWDQATRQKIASGGDPAFKARGISARAFSGHIQEVDDHFGKWADRYPQESSPDRGGNGWYPKISFDSGFAMVTCQQALQRGKWELAGTLGHEPVEGGCPGCSGAHLIQDSDPIGKRHSGYWQDGVYWSRPFKDGGPDGIESMAYDKRFGQPDPEQYGINDDGSVKELWAHMLK